MRNFITYLIYVSKKYMGADESQYRGCPKILEETEDKYKITLPKVFRDYVSAMGIKGPSSGSEPVCEMMDWLTEDVSPIIINGIPQEEQKFVFFFNTVDQNRVYFFKCNDMIDDDPVVYTCDDGSDIEKKTNRFSYFLNRSDGRDALKFFNEYIRTQSSQEFTIMSIYKQDTFLPSEIFNNIGRWYYPKRKKLPFPKDFPKNFLILHNKGLCRFPKNVANTDLEFLELNSNEIADFEPNDFLEIPNLRYLLLEHNRISNIPEELFFLRTLEYLSLKNNLLTELSDQVGNLENLIELNLNTNDLKEFPKTINRLKNLKFLSVKGNLLEGFPKIKGLDNLLYLNLGYNRIKEFSIDFREVPKLEYLCLPMNELTHVEFKNIEGSSIKKIDLGANHLTEFPDVPEEYRDRIIMVGNPLNN